jgi:hypothetical protein
VSPGRTVYSLHLAGGGQGVEVGGLCVGVAVGNTVTTMIAGVWLAVGVGELVKVGDAVGKGVDVQVGAGWTATVLVGIAAGNGRGVAVGVGSSVSGVNWAAIGVGCGAWKSTGRSPSASTKAATTVRVTTATAKRLVSNGRHGDGSGFGASVRWGSVGLLAMILMNSALVRLVGTQVQGGDIHFHPRVIVSLADGQQEAESGPDAHLAFDPDPPAMGFD